MNHMIRKYIGIVLQSDLSAYRIHKRTKVAQSTISDLRHHHRKIENLTLKTVNRLIHLGKQIETGKVRKD